ncbi:MAG: methyl-accepting chemotaxis protein, partial [Dehalococcoidales bacterium]|nr:methyl-accepting chemotaxis protein [Dehalococcoidales bacterium]
QYGMDADRIEPKVSYVKAFKAWGWVVGTGVYTVDVNTAVSAARNQYMILSSIIAVLCCGFFYVVAMSMSRNIEKVSHVAQKLALGDTDQQINIKSNDEIGDMGAALGNVVDYLTEMSNSARRISNGDLSLEVTPKSDEDTLSKSFIQMTASIKAMLQDVNMMAEDAINGKLATRADVSRHQGDYAAIVDGVNKTLDSLVGFMDDIPSPAMIINTDYEILYINKMGAALGNTTPDQLVGNRIHCYDYFKKGDCRTARCACNQAMQNNRQTVSESDAHPGNSNLEIKYTGLPIRNRAGNVIGALEFIQDQTDIKNAAKLAQKIADYQEVEIERLGGNLKNIAAGDLACDFNMALSDADTREAGEKFRKLFDALQVTVKTIELLINDTIVLSNAAIEGKLSTRADISQHQGEFRKIVDGVNKTLDAVILPVNEAAAVLQKLAENDLTVRVNGDYRGDHVIIKNALNQAIDSLAGLVQQLRNQALNLATSSKQLSEGAQQSGKAVQQIAGASQQMASGAHDQSQSTQQVTTAMETFTKAVNNVNVASAEQNKMVEQASQVINQVVAAITQVTRNAQDASGAASKSSQSTQNAEDMTRRTAEAVNSIKTSIAVMSKTIGEMSERATQIGKIVETIDDIAAQTNLLALNAAIEAARAGEHGSGFAVVADEVRNLAERTAVATKETADLIGDMQVSVKKAVDGATSADRQVVEGAKLSLESANLLKEVLGEVEKAQSQIEQISAAAEEISASSNEMVKTIDIVSQSAGQNSRSTLEITANLGQITRSVENVAGISEENSSATEEVSASVEEVNAQIEEIIALSQSLDGMANELQKAVGQFRLNEST